MGKTVARICAFAAYEAIGLGFIGGALSTGTLRGAVLLASYLLGVALALVLMRFVPQGAASQHRLSDQLVLPCLAALLSCAGIVLRVVSDGLAHGVVLALLFAFAACVGLLLTFSCLCCLDSLRPEQERELRVLAYAPVLLGMAFTLVMYWAVEPLRTIVFSVLPLAVVCLFASRTLFPWKPIQRSESLQQSEVLHLSQRMDALLFSFAAALGLCLSQLARPSGSVVFSALGAVTLALLVLVWFGRGRLALSPGRYHALMLPLCIALLCALMLCGTRAGQACACVAVPLACLQAATNRYCLIRNAGLYGLRMDMHVAVGRTWPCVGMCVGLAIGVGCMRAPELLGADTLRIAAAVLAVVLCAAFALTHGSEFVIVADGLLDYREGGDGRLVTAAAPHEDDARERCERLAQHAGLTPRESEIVVLLARGYNSTSIAQILCISPQTAKTHAYRIYQKAGVHSQQELIALLDDTRGSAA